MKRSVSDESVSKLSWAVRAILTCSVLALSLILLLFTNLPFQDMPNHLARYYLLTRDFGSDLFTKFYSLNLRVIPNIGVDFVMSVLGRIIDPSVALHLLLVSMLCFYCYGWVKLSLARNNGEWNPALILLPATFFSYSLILGFLNFVFALSLLPYFIYKVESIKSDKVRLLLVVIFTVVLFFTHMMAAVLFLLMVTTGRLFDSRGKNWKPEVAVFCLSMFLVLVLYKFSATSGEHSTVVWTSVPGKVKNVLASFVIGPRWKLTTVSMFAGLVIVAIVNFRAYAKRDVAVIAMLIVVYLLCPEGFKLSGCFDARIPPIIFALLISFARRSEGLSFAANRDLVLVLSTVMGVVGLSTFLVVRKTNTEGDRMRRILHAIPSGDSLFIADINNASAMHRNYWYPAYKLIPYYTAIDRPLFISGVFTFPSEQPLVMKDGLEFLQYASRIWPPGTGVDRQVQSVMSDIRPRRDLLRTLGVDHCWVFFVNYESTGFRGCTLPDTVYEDGTYCLLRIGT